MSALFEEDNQVRYKEHTWYGMELIVQKLSLQRPSFPSMKITPVAIYFILGDGMGRDGTISSPNSRMQSIGCINE